MSKEQTIEFIQVTYCIEKKTISSARYMSGTSTRNELETRLVNHNIELKEKYNEELKLIFNDEPLFPLIKFLTQKLWKRNYIDSNLLIDTIYHLNNLKRELENIKNEN